MTLALIRFVNSLLDPLQRRDKNLPLSVLASTAGLPASFVEVRHWGTHEPSLPGVEVLREMGIRALEWLWHNYWNKQNEEVDLFQRWEMGGSEANKVVASVEGNLHQSCERLVTQLGDDGEFDVTGNTWDTLIARLSEEIPAFPATFTDYLLQTLESIPSSITSLCPPESDCSFNGKFRTSGKVPFQYLDSDILSHRLANGEKPSAEFYNYRQTMHTSPKHSVYPILRHL
jgi:hypothetical protein